MTMPLAAITGIGVGLPKEVLTNADLSKIVNTSDEWITARVGITKRHILKEKDKGSSYLGVLAVKDLLEKTCTAPEEIDLLICSTVTADMHFPANANIISHHVGIKNAFSFDINAACSGFIYTLATAAQFIETGKYKKVVVVGAEKMSSITDYTDRTTCVLFGDAAGAVLLEPAKDRLGIRDFWFRSDGIGESFLHQKGGGSRRPPSAETLANGEHFIYQEGKQVFFYAVPSMVEATENVMKRNGLSKEDIAWLVPHQANLRIINYVGERLGLPPERIMVNIQRYGNTTSATIPLCLWEYEKKLQRGDNIILTAFGAGFSWGSVYLKWAYNGNY